MKTLTFLLCILIATSLCAQDVSKENLAALQDEELLELFNQVYTDSIKAEKVARTYLNRARAQGDTIKMARGYDRLARIFHPEKNLRFADSVIFLTKEKSHISYPAMGFMIKAYEYERLNKLPEATENFYLLYDYAIRNDNIEHQLFSLHNLIIFKSFWGNKIDAIDLQHFRNNLLKSPDLKNKLRKSVRSKFHDSLDEVVFENEIFSIYSYVVCYMNIKDYEKVSAYIDIAFDKLKSYTGRYKADFQIWFLEAQLEEKFHTEDYTGVFEVKKELESLVGSTHYTTLSADVYGFFGQTLLKLQMMEEGIQYLKDADSILSSGSGRILPYQRRIYDILLENYISEDDILNQLETYKKLKRIDSIFKINYKFFEPEMIKKFETPMLLKEKEELIAGLEKKQKVTKSISYWYLLIAILSLTAFLFYYSRQRTYRQRYENLIAKQSKPQANISNQNIVTSISTSIISDILTSLEQFESKQEYLSQNISLTKLAKTFGTNSNYLSKVINLKMEKSFPQYINDLRVDYAAEELRTNRQFRRFTIKAIAEDCGFRSAESFSKAFYKSHGIYPSYYIKKLNKKNEGL